MLPCSRSGWSVIANILKRNTDIYVHRSLTHSEIFIFRLNIVDYLIGRQQMIIASDITSHVVPIKRKRVSRWNSVPSQRFGILAFFFSLLICSKILTKMIYQVLFVCLLGVQTAYGWNAVGRLSNLTKINLSNNPVCKLFTSLLMSSRHCLSRKLNQRLIVDMGGHRHQLNCVGEKKLCDQYFGDPIDCESKGCKLNTISGIRHMFPNKPQTKFYLFPIHLIR